MQNTGAIFVLLMTKEGKNTLVNIEAIEDFEKSGKGSIIHYINGREVLVKESPGEVDAAISEAKTRELNHSFTTFGKCMSSITQRMDNEMKKFFKKGPDHFDEDSDENDTGIGGKYGL